MQLFKFGLFTVSVGGTTYALIAMKESNVLVRWLTIIALVATIIATGPDALGQVRQLVLWIASRPPGLTVVLSIIVGGLLDFWVFPAVRGIGTAFGDAFGGVPRDFLHAAAVIIILSAIGVFCFGLIVALFNVARMTSVFHLGLLLSLVSHPLFVIHDPECGGREWGWGWFAAGMICCWSGVALLCLGLLSAWPDVLLTPAFR